MSLKTNNLIQGLVLLLLIVILPLGSWYYMDSGYNYYKTAMGELHDYGTLPTFSLKTQNGTLLTNEMVKNKMAISVFVNPENPKSEGVLKDIKKLHKQFDKRNDLYFLVHIMSANEMSAAALTGLANQYGLVDKEQCFLLNGNLQSMTTLAGGKYKIPDLTKTPTKENPITLTANESITDYPYIVLVDNKQVIRNYYDAYQITSIRRLVEHISLILPKEVQNRPVLLREKEK